MSGPGLVLIIDDSTMSRRKLAGALRQLGHQWVEADDGQAGLSLMREQDFDLVLLDIVMPEMDGLEVLEWVQRDRRLSEMPVLVISGIDDDMSMVARAIELGAADFLPKTFDPTVFQARVNACIEKRRLRRVELDYLAQLDQLTAAAAVMEEKAFHPRNLGLEGVVNRDDALGRLARVFAEMAQQVYDRERALQRNIRTATGLLLLLVAGLIAGLQNPITVILSREIPYAVGLSFWSDLLPGILCVGLALALKRFSRMSRQMLTFLTMWAVLNVIAGIALLEAAGRVTGIVLSIVASLEGLIVFLIAATLRIEEASLRRFLGLSIGLAGVVLLIVARETSDGLNPWYWVLFALIVPLSWALADILIAARGKQQGLDLIAGLGVMYLISAALTLPLAFLRGEFFMIGVETGWLTWLIAFQAVADALDYILFVVLIALAGAVFGSQAAYVATLSGIVWSMVILGEMLTSGTVAALALIMVGLLVVGPKSEAADMEVQFVPRSKRRDRLKWRAWN